MRMLQQMEQALVNEDPKLVSALRGTAMVREASPQRAILAAVCLLLGIGVLLLGASRQQTAIGVVGFLLMLGSAFAMLTALRGRQVSFESLTKSSATKTRRGRSASGGGFTSRMEQRWQRRSEDEI
jgi:hypothetical protein